MAPAPAARVACSCVGAVGGGLLAAGVLAACGGESGGGQAAVSSGKVELNLWTHDPGYVKTFTEQAKRLTDAPGGRYD
ncbi:hypothetical protein ACIBO5_40830 [Nonomuraea angiospora]|uniref:hypothetical protein n=1 Tax=Nonomuraea angiospora TaxID=46172 RepID=UPI0037A32D68